MRCKPNTARSFPIKLVLVVLGISLALGAVSSAAQPPRNPRGDFPRGDDGRAGNPLRSLIFPPDLVMAHQTELGLSEEQRQKLITEVQQMEADMVPLRFEISETTQRLARMLSAPKVDEEQALALVDRVTELEGQVKRRHLTLVVRTKNLLTAEQQAKLRELRGEGPRRRR